MSGVAFDWGTARVAPGRPPSPPRCCADGIWVLRGDRWACSQHGRYERVLTEREIAHAEQQSSRRQEINLKHGRQDQNHFDRDALEAHQIGAVCEYAASLILQQPWNNPVCDAPVKGPDVGPYYIKGTRPPDGYLGPLHLIVRKSDLNCPSGPYILALHALPKVALLGWCHASEVPEIGEWCKFRPDRPAWWVSARRLRSMESLPE